jgi:hypothetical protein
VHTSLPATITIRVIVTTITIITDAADVTAVTVVMVEASSPSRRR